MNHLTLAIISLSTYLTVAFTQGLHLFGKVTFSRWAYFAGSLLAITSHGWILYKLIDTPLGQNMDWLIMLSFTLWLMNLFTLTLSLRWPIGNLCVLTYPLAAISLVCAMLMGGNEAIVTKTQPEILPHIFISLFAMSLLTMGSLQAILLGLQNFLLKHHHPSAMLRILPPLQTMEGLLFFIIWCGQLFLCASLGSGFFYNAPLLTPHLLPKTILAISAWFSLTLLLVGRYFFGWRGPTAIRWTLSGTVLAILSYFGTKALLI